MRAELNQQVLSRYIGHSFCHPQRVIGIVEGEICGAASAAEYLFCLWEGSCED